MAVDIQSAAILKVNALVDIANAVMLPTMPYPTVTFRASGTRAGAAYLQQNRVNFHRILMQHYPQEYLNNVIPHEVAHLLVHFHFGRCKPHGNEWQSIMQRLFKCSPKVTHTMDVSVLNRKSFNYSCGCKNHQLTTRRHNAIMRGKTLYRCTNCGEALMLEAPKSADRELIKSAV